MVEIVVTKRKAVARQSEILTSGSVGISVNFIFSQDWEGLSRTAVFSNGSVTRDVVLYGSECVIPHECLVTSGKTLTVGVYGTDGETIVIPTVCCALGRVLQGADPSGDPSIPPTPTAVQQIMSAAANAVNVAQRVRNDADAGAFDGTDGYSPAVTITDIEGGHRVTITDAEHPQGQSFDVLDGQGGGGTGYHRQLTNRDAADQHPMSAISGLVSALAGKQATISDLAEIRAGAELGGTAVQTEEDPTVPAWAKQQTKPSYTKAEVGLGNVANERQYSVANPPPYPVTSVNGKTGAVNLGAADVGAATEGYVDSEISEATTDMATQTWVEGKSYITAADIPVLSINGKTGVVVLTAADLGLTDVFNLKGSKPTYTALPATGNVTGDVWYVVDESVGYIWLNDGTTNRWEQLGLSVDLSNYVTTEALATALTGYVVKVAGKGLSTNDFTDSYKTKLDNAITSLVGYATEAWVEAKGYLTQHQSLAAYRTSAAQDVIDDGKLDKSGGTMTGNLTMDGTVLSFNGNVKISLGNTNFLSTTNIYNQIGMTARTTNIRGNTKRPYYVYNNASTELALLSDLTGKADKPTIKTVMDAVATVNTMYFLGAQSAVSIVLPSGASAGDRLSVVWYNSATAATLSVTGTVLTVDYAPSANSRSELNAMWDGTYWCVVTNEQEVTG